MGKFSFHAWYELVLSPDLMGTNYSAILYVCTVLRENLAGIKFGEMAQNGCNLISAKFKFGDLSVIYTLAGRPVAALRCGLLNGSERKLPRLEASITAIYTPEELAWIGKYAVQNCRVRGVSALVLAGRFKSPTRVCFTFLFAYSMSFLVRDYHTYVQWEVQVLLIQRHIAGTRVPTCTEPIQYYTRG